MEGKKVSDVGIMLEAFSSWGQSEGECAGVKDEMGGVTSTFRSMCQSKRKLKWHPLRAVTLWRAPGEELPLPLALWEPGPFLQHVALPVPWLQDRVGTSSSLGAHHLMVVMAAHVTFTR